MLRFAVFLAVKIKLFTAGLLKSIFFFMGYISDCSALTHMFLQACNMLHRATSSSSPPLSALTRFTGWMAKSPLTGRSCECLCGTLYKRAGTHRTLFSTSGCPLFAQTAEGLHGAGGPSAVDEGTSGSQLDAHQLHEDLLTSNCEADMFYLKADDAVETPTINGL